MSITLLPVDLKIKLLELCPQLRYVFPELRELLKYFNKKEYLEYPTIKNYFMETKNVEYQGINLSLKVKNWDCIFKMVEGTWSSESVTFHPSLPYFTVGCRNNNGLFMEISENKTVDTIFTFEGYSNYIQTTTFHPFLPIMATADDGVIKLWNIENLNEHYCFAILREHVKKIHLILFHPKLPILVSMCVDRKIILWKINDFSNPTIIITLHEEFDTFNSFTFHPSKPFFLTGRNHVKLWKIDEEWNVIHQATFEENQYILTLKMHPTLPLLATNKINNFISLRRINNELTDAIFIDDIDSVVTNEYSMAFHPTLPIITMCSTDCTIKLCRISDENTVECITLITGHTQKVHAMSFHLTLPLFVTGSNDNTAKIWRISENGKIEDIITTLKGYCFAICVVNFHSKLPILFTMCADRTIQIWK